MKLLDRDEVYFLTELLNTFAEHKEDETAGPGLAVFAF